MAERAGAAECVPGDGWCCYCWQCVVGMVAFDVSGAYSVQQAQLSDQAAAACDAAGSDTNLSLAFNNAVQVSATKSNTAQSVQASSEALTLLLVSVAFLVVVSWCMALFRMMERDAARALLSYNNGGGNMRASEANAARIVGDTMQAAAQHRRRLTAACVIVLLTFPARSAFDLLNAYANFNTPTNPACGTCDPCQSTASLINSWLAETPEIQAVVVAVSSPLLLALSLWLLTKAIARSRSIAEQMQQARAGDGV